MAKIENINFKTSESHGRRKRKGKQEVGSLKTRLEFRFDKRMLSAEKYCKAYGFDLSMFAKVMEGRVTGTKAKPDSPTRRIIARLKVDGIWIGKLPWEK